MTSKESFVINGDTRRRNGFVINLRGRPSDVDSKTKGRCVVLPTTSKLGIEM
jgi:hypothetical protein